MKNAWMFRKDKGRYVVEGTYLIYEFRLEERAIYASRIFADLHRWWTTPISYCLDDNGDG